ncbi:MAG: C10 family peptidase [Bacteroidales bacterium]|nr:C10 family peptidase [Bacteroidales bacterium]
MKIYFTLLLLAIVLLSQILSAQNRVSYQEATVLARNFYIEKISQSEKIGLDAVDIHDIQLIQNSGHEIYYAVNLHHGFVLVSTVKNTFPILAYSFDGSFSTPRQNTNTAAWLGQYERQIRFAQQNNIEATEKIKESWATYLDPDFIKNHKFEKLRSIEPMLVSNWDQGVYYNTACPADPAGVGGHCVTGCVATALGQLLYYFRYPQSGEGSYSYEDPNYGTIFANFEEANYDYDQMMNVLNDPNPEVAELIFHLGVACDMVYGPQSSGMYNHKAAHALRTHFRFSPETQYVFRDSTTMDWDSLLVTHLDQKIPMYYAGWSVPNVNGHAFIVDGYQEDHFYHFNWGWGGSNDGYFYTEELTPGGNNFNLAQELIINAFPDTVNNAYPDYCTGSHEIDYMRGTFTDGSYPVYNYQNNTECQWLIDPQNEEDSVTNITLSFQRFNTETDVDFVKIYDGENSSAPLIGEFSGDQIPNNITSSGNKMLVTFLSDDENTMPGFFATFESNQPSWCGGTTVMLEQQGTFSDGSQNFFYNNSATCMWQIMPINANSVTVYFTNFDIESGQDHVKIYDSQTMTLLADYSGYYPPDAPPPPLTSESGKIFFLFHSDESGRAQGWEAGYYSDLVNIENPDKSTTFQVFPNPAQEILNIRFNEEIFEPVGISMINQLGEVIIKRELQKVSPSTLSLDVSKAASGIYYLKISTEKQQTLKKVVINKGI